MLLGDLAANDTFNCKTICSDRDQLLENFAKHQLEKGERVFFQGKLFSLHWKNKQCMSLASTIHGNPTKMQFKIIVK